MNTALNYLIEANLSLFIMMAVYALLLRRETDYNLKRYYLLMSVVISVLAPFIHISPSSFVPQIANALPSVHGIIPTQWLPEVLIDGGNTTTVTNKKLIVDAWYLLDFVYASGVIISLIMFIAGISTLLRAFSSAGSSRSGKFVILESEDNRSSFSFFRYIYIGQAGNLSAVEKEFIIRHEQVHAGRLHSFDILLINIVGIFFWFNPLIRLYKRMMIQVHEFEADAIAVKTGDTDQYCSLLAKVALLSADYKLANHFSNSLTINRIDMIRKLKSKVTVWKLTVLIATLPCMLFLIGCNDQVSNDLTQITQNATNALVVPDVIQKRFDELKLANPSTNFLLVEFNEAAQTKLTEMEKTYGIPKSIELYTPDADIYKGSVLNRVTIVAYPGSDKRAIAETAAIHTYAIIEYNEKMSSLLHHAASDDEIFNVVEEPAQFPGGNEALAKYIQKTVKYPRAARTQGDMGTVFISFVVEKDGTLSNMKIAKSVSPELDDEAKRVVSSFPTWTPGKQDGQVVRSQFFMPMTFAFAVDHPTSAGK